MFSCEYCETFKNSFFIEHLLWLLQHKSFTTKNEVNETVLVSLMLTLTRLVCQWFFIAFKRQLHPGVKLLEIYGARYPSTELLFNFYLFHPSKCKIKIYLKALERRKWSCSHVFNVDFHPSCLYSAFILSLKRQLHPCVEILEIVRNLWCVIPI